MAGAIIINNQATISLNSSGFDYITEHIRPCFEPDEKHVVDEIYSPVDEGGMSFISLKEANTETFAAFVRAASRAYEKESESIIRADSNAAWGELMAALLADSRLRKT